MTEAPIEDNKDLMDLYSRQIGAFGVETMKNILTLDVLVIGAGGVGAEAAKNLILAGPRSVTLYDRAPVALADLGSNCFLRPEHVGQRRAAVCLDALAKLNPYVRVRELEDEALTAAAMQRFGVVLATDSTLGWAKLAELGAACHACGTAFVVGVAPGITATMFSDFGEKHVITDSDGEPPTVVAATAITVEQQEQQGGRLRVVVVGAKSNHGLADGECVQFAGVCGAGVDALNGLGAVAVKRVYITVDSNKRQRLVPDRFELALTAEQEAKLRAAGPEYRYVNGGVATQVKKPVQVRYAPFAEAAVNPLATSGQPMVLHPDTSKMFADNRGGQLHVAQRALWAFVDAHGGQLPRLHCAEDAAACVAIAQKLVDEARALGADKALVLEQLDEAVVRKTALYARAELPGVATFVGGVVAQEAVKKFGKFTPLRQWMHMDYLELVPADGSVRADAAPTGTRYDSQIAVLGRAAHERLADQKWFMVGCGALGCEYLKGFALMGLGTGANGLVHVTDMDRIEVSNLNRQFLFRRENVGQQKAVCAAAAAAAMNPAIKVQCHETKVCPETEDVFDDAFWQSLTGVCNALDNVQARMYVDGRCVFYEKPLLEAGTLGTLCNSEIILPHQTACYSEHTESDAGEAIPMCTLRNFPYLIDHCIEWARARFTDVFDSPVRDALQFLDARSDFLAHLAKSNIDQQLETLASVRRVLAVACDPKRSFATCLQLAVDDFQAQHYLRIRDLQHSFPESATKKDPDTGAVEPFWSGTKRYPRAAAFDRTNPEHAAFAMACANLYAAMYSIPQVTDRAQFADILAHADLKLADWVAPASKVVDDSDDNSATGESAAPSSSSSGDELDKLEKQKDATIQEIAQMCAEHAPVRPVAAEFEKDDDTNFHVDFITACANMRAWNYHIPEAPRHQVKMIAGRIIPAIATTTAMVTGAVCMEMYKLVLGLPKSSFCSCNINLATMTFQFFEPEAPGKAQKQYDVIEMADVLPVPAGFTCWDKVVVDKGPLTLRQFLAAFPDVHHGCQVRELYKESMTPEESARLSNKPLYTECAFTDTIRAFVDANMDRPLLDVYTDIYGAPPPTRNFLCLAGSFATADDEPAKVPPVRYVFRH